MSTISSFLFGEAAMNAFDDAFDVFEPFFLKYPFPASPAETFQSYVCFFMSCSN